MGHLAVFLILFLSISCAASHTVENKFKQCMLSKANKNSESIGKVLHSNTSSQYPKVLNLLEQNLRWPKSSKKPYLILTPFHESEIQAAILCSKENGLQIRVRSGGHDYEGLSYLCNAPFVMIDLINIRDININLSDETAWVQAGASLGELYYKISKASKVHAFPAGLCPSIGVGGHFSGGGFGTLLRKYGLAADNILDAKLIDANGKIHDKISMGEDVFWAIRGGSATSFGIILSWRIKLVKVPPIVTAFNVYKTLDGGATKLIHKWQNIAHEFNEDLFVRILAQNSGDSSKTFEAIFNSLYLGRIHDLIPLMNVSFPELGLQAKDCTEMSWIQSILFFAGFEKDDPPEILLNRTTTYRGSFKGKSDFVTKPIPEAGLEGAWKMLMEEETMAMMIMDPFGGRMNKISATEIPFPHRKGILYNIQYYMKWEDNGIEDSNRHLKWINMLYRYMTPYVSKSPRCAYLNYRDLDIGKNKVDNTSYSEASVWGTKYFMGNFRRLAQIKTKFDPQNFFSYEQSIPLLTSPASS